MSSGGVKKQFFYFRQKLPSLLETNALSIYFRLINKHFELKMMQIRHLVMEIWVFSKKIHNGPGIIMHPNMDLQIRSSNY